MLKNDKVHFYKNLTILTHTKHDFVEYYLTELSLKKRKAIYFLQKDN